jgi:uncharacterized membrane protein
VTETQSQTPVAKDRDRKNVVSELIVIAFRDRFRAAEVLNELKRRERDWVGDLDDAIAVTLDEHGKARVQLSLDLSPSENASWIGLWSSLLRLALFVPISVTMATGKERLPNPAIANKQASPARWGIPNGAWWTEDLHLPENFLRDIGALIKPETSAIFMLLHTQKVSLALQHIYNYGGMTIHTSLSPEQVDKMTAQLAVA